MTAQLCLCLIVRPVVQAIKMRKSQWSRSGSADMQPPVLLASMNEHFNKPWLVCWLPVDWSDVLPKLCCGSVVRDRHLGRWSWWHTLSPQQLQQQKRSPTLPAVLFWKVTAKGCLRQQEMSQIAKQARAEKGKSHSPPNKSAAHRKTMPPKVCVLIESVVSLV